MIESILQRYPHHEASFYRSSGGAEIDLILEKGSQRIAIEIKSSSTPKVSQGFDEALRVVQPQMFGGSGACQSFSTLKTRHLGSPSC